MKKKSVKNKPASRKATGESGNTTVRFEYFDPAARTVALAGDFNGWNASVRPLARDSGGLWAVSVSLAPGTYHYKFVVDGERWEQDPANAEVASNEQGSFNSVRRVP